MFKVIDTSERKGNGFENLTGKKYGRLKVKGLSDRSSGRKSYWFCVCDCGNTKEVRSDSLKSGNVKSCGCLKNEQNKINLTRNHRHKESRTHLHDTWLGMKFRCNNQNHKSYKRYGGRGIKVCSEWNDSYESFRDWAKDNGYKDGLSIERLDVNGNYEPSNCSWLPMKEQANNRRNTIWVEWQGKRQNLMQWANEFDINYTTLNDRYKRGDKPPYLFREPDIYNTKSAKMINWNGKTNNIKGWSSELGISYSTLKARVHRGVQPPELFNKPKI